MTAAQRTGDLPAISEIRTATYRFPTEEPEADGTLDWDATTAVVVHIAAGDTHGLGWSYTSPAAATIVDEHLAPVLRDSGVSDPAAVRANMHRACRNIGTRGVVAHALSAVDIALWDLRARLVGESIADQLNRSGSGAPVYGSGGFVNLTERQLDGQLDWWLGAGCTAVKIKIGRDANRDIARVEQVIDRVGPDVEVMVDANGAYSVEQAVEMGGLLDGLGVSWFEEPVTSDNPHGLNAVRAALACDVTAGEYIYDSYDATALFDVVDCLQLDATRCGGYTGFLALAARAAAHGLEVSAHCAPALHAPIAVAVPNLRHIEWFVDHARLEPILVTNPPQVHGGLLEVPRANPGHGMTIAETAHPHLRTPTSN